MKREGGGLKNQRNVLRVRREEKKGGGKVGQDAQISFGLWLKWFYSMKNSKYISALMFHVWTPYYGGMFGKLARLIFAGGEKK